GIKIRFLQLPLGATWMAPILVLGVFIFDTTLVTLSRMRRGRSPFLGGSDHTSHRLAQLGLSKPRAVLTLYVAALMLGALAIVVTRLPVLTANIIFGTLVLLGLIALLLFERINPALSGDPPIVLIPGGGGYTEALRAVAGVSHNVTVIVAPREVGGQMQPTRADVIDIIAALAEESAATRALLERGLSDEWPRDLPGLQRALRLHGHMIAVGALADEGGEAEALASLRKAQLVVLGPGEVNINLETVLAVAAVRAEVENTAAKVWASIPPSMNGTASNVIPSAALASEIQRRLLGEAAGRAKGWRAVD
ncbi:MAG: hypothetical protein ACT4QE_21500, partial [Anaerolineales bacterium]